MATMLSSLQASPDGDTLQARSAMPVTINPRTSNFAGNVVAMDAALAGPGQQRNFKEQAKATRSSELTFRLKVDQQPKQVVADKQLVSEIRPTSKIEMLSVNPNNATERYEDKYNLQDM